MLAAVNARSVAGGSSSSGARSTHERGACAPEVNDHRGAPECAHCAARRVAANSQFYGGPRVDGGAESALSAARRAIARSNNSKAIVTRASGVGRRASGVDAAACRVLLHRVRFLACFPRRGSVHEFRRVRAIVPEFRFVPEFRTSGVGTRGGFERPRRESTPPAKHQSSPRGPNFPGKPPKVRCRATPLAKNQDPPRQTPLECKRVRPGGGRPEFWPAVPFLERSQFVPESLRAASRARARRSLH